MWEMAGYTQVLAGTRQVLLDHRGHGKSDCPEGVENHRIEEYVADVIAVLDAVEVERAILVGYSAGAFVAYGTAARHPDRCSGVVGIGGVALPDESYESWDPLIDRVREFGMPATMQHMAAREEEPCPPWMLENLSSTKSEMFALLMEAWLDAPSEWEWFPKITAPTLIICGEHEDGQGETALAASTVQDGQAVLLPGFGHLQAFWHGEITAPAIRDFLVSRGLIEDVY
jgi:pimeloyl-ACP methyl ester carboxylesterase